MAWTTPKTWATGNSVTAALLNANIRDNFNALIRPVGIVDDWAYPDSLPNPITGMQMQCGLGGFTCSGGQVVVLYPTSFANTTIVSLMGDHLGSANVFFLPDVDHTTNYYATFWAFDTTTNTYLAGSVIVNVAWLALGF